MVMENLQHGRFKDATWYPGDQKIYTIIGGAGGIGSWLTLLIARAGFKPIIFDFDTIEIHNLGGQLFRTGSIGKEKTQEVTDLVANLSGTFCETYSKFDENSPVGRYMFSGFDNMDARILMFNRWKDKFAGDANSIFIDGRLLAEQMQIFCITGNDQQSITNYEKNYLFADTEVADGPCTLKQTSHSAAMIASHMTAFFTNFIHNINQKDNSRRVPFYWEYFIPLDMIETF